VGIDLPIDRVDGRYPIKGDTASANAQLQAIKRICGTVCEEYQHLAVAIADPTDLSELALPPAARPTRRGLVHTAAGLAAAAAGGLGPGGGGERTGSAGEQRENRAEPFWGAYQGGITTPLKSHLHGRARPRVGKMR
jgi:hypothetical protein